MRFSQRIGITPPSKAIQRESMDESLRNSLWNALTVFYWKTHRNPGRRVGRSDFVRGSNLENLIKNMWISYFKEPIDTIPKYWEYCLRHLREYFFSAEWYEVYDFIEFVANYKGLPQRKEFIDMCNSFLERENAAYRFVNGKLVEITSKEEIEEIEKAIANSTPYAGVKAHLESAIKLMSDKKQPDYRNSIKESISAVEALAKTLAKDDSATLGSILKELERGNKLHPALKKAFSSLYGYTNDADGIRHALLEKPKLELADARFMLICCSAFINYVIDVVKT